MLKIFGEIDIFGTRNASTENCGTNNIFVRLFLHLHGITGCLPNRDGGDYDRMKKAQISALVTGNPESHDFRK